MALTRREFLERTGWAIAALGISQASFLGWGDRYQQALADGNPGGLALLIGINQYPESVSDLSPIHGNTLNGCLTDVSLQTELLVHRFGFQPADIVSLTNAKATRQGIIDAFQSHLVEQARPSDRVLFHFSGLGSLVRSPKASEPLKTLVPVDGVLPTDENPTLQDLSLSTLNSLLTTLTTPNVTTLLDAAFTNRGQRLQGNFRIRSRPSMPEGKVSPLDSLAQVNQQPLSPDGLRGLYLAASQDQQPALEGQWSDFSAGLLTYALTQYLWEMTPPRKIQVVFPAIANRVHQSVGGLQTPVVNAKRNPKSLYSKPPQVPAAEGVVKSVREDGTAEIWLGGLPSQVLECYGSKSVMTTTEADLAVNWVGRSRQGLVLRAALDSDSEISPATLVGKPVHEAVRLIPRSLGLTIALDPGLERIERVDATSAFAAAKVNVVAAGEQAADLVFGKAPQKTLTAAASDSLPTPVTAISYGLFYPSRVAVPGTLNPDEEAVKTAVNRLTPKLPRLLAIKYLQLTENAVSSTLAVRATLETADTAANPITQAITRRALAGRAIAPLKDIELPAVASATSLQCRVQNLDTEPLYLLWVTLPQSNRPLRVAMLSDEVADSPTQAIAPNDVITFPQAALGSGQVEIFLIASRTPFLKTADLITDQQTSGNNLDPLQVSLARVQSILEDLSQSSDSSDPFALHVNNWATLRMRYQIA